MCLCVVAGCDKNHASNSGWSRKMVMEEVNLWENEAGEKEETPWDAQEARLKQKPIKLLIIGRRDQITVLWIKEWDF